MTSGPIVAIALSMLARVLRTICENTNGCWFDETVDLWAIHFSCGGLCPQVLWKQIVGKHKLKQKEKTSSVIAPKKTEPIPP